MTKKRPFNGFMYFADAQHAVYTAKNKSVHLTVKKLVKRATWDWKMMNENERRKWRSESRRRHDEVLCIFYWNQQITTYIMQKHDWWSYNSHGYLMK